MESKPALRTQPNCRRVVKIQLHSLFRERAQGKVESPKRAAPGPRY